MADSFNKSIFQIEKLWILIGFLFFHCSSLDYYKMLWNEKICFQCEKPGLDCREAFSTQARFNADFFEFPVGSPSGGGYYIAQEFGEKNERFRGRYHLGEDWNYRGGGDSDYGAPVYSIGRGIVTQVESLGSGWGKILRVCHKLSPRLREYFEIEYVESIYAHLYDFHVEPGELVETGQWIGSIGDGDGRYIAHLHFEIRSEPGMPLGGGYSHPLPPNYVNPMKFLSFFQKRIAY